MFEVNKKAKEQDPWDILSVNNYAKSPIRTLEKHSQC